MNLDSVISQSFSSSSSSFSVGEGSLPRSNSIGWRRQSADGSLVPATRKTAENENDDEDDWEMTLNRDRIDAKRCGSRLMCLAPVIWPEGPAPKGQGSLAQGLPWVSRYKRFALKGLGMRTRSGAKVRRGCRWPLQGQFGWGELPRVNPGLCSPGPSGQRRDPG